MWPSLFFSDVPVRLQFDLLSKDHRILLLDPPGHGRSEAPRRTFTPDDCADAAVRILDDFGIDRAVFLGASWGGPVCVTAALNFPERVRGLIVMNGPMHPFSAMQRMRFKLLVAIYERFGPLGFLVGAVTKLQLSKESRTAHPELQAANAERFRSADRHGVALAMRSVLLGRSPSLGPRLKELRMPALFVMGSRDAIVDVDAARAAATATNTRFEVVQGSAHQSGFEVPERVNPIITDFLRTIDAAS